ncbi:hypothetical protein LJB42_003828 [Komagataella kurtzmanii]|nr:hypothetical protein LJB42_003828 [Komagataella kurtzmanii]
MEDSSKAMVYSATYSGVPVYELVTPLTSVMRRKSDDWINATHILKVADFPKAKRTRILERDIQVGTHEKVQGGYGKYQGTWVPLESAVKIAETFDVRDILEPLFAYVQRKGSPSPPPAPKHQNASKGSAAKKKLELKKKLSAAAGTVPDEKVKRRGRPPKPKDESGNSTTILDSNIKKAPSQPRLVRRQQSSNPNYYRNQVHQQRNISNLSDLSRRSLKYEQTPLQLLPQVSREGSYLPSTQDTRINLANFDLESSPVPKDLHSDLPDFRSPQGEHNEVEEDLSNSESELMSGDDLANALRSPVNKNSAKSQLEQSLISIGKGTDDKPLQTWYKPNSDQDYVHMLLEYFLAPDGNYEPKIPYFLSSETIRQASDSSKFDPNLQIDHEGHTALHWACAMGDLRMCTALLNHGANTRAWSNIHQVPIMRAVCFTNAYYKRSFAQLLDLLRETLLDCDKDNRNLLHLIVSQKLGSSASRYYMELVIAKVSEIQPRERVLNFINQQDSNGDTALHIAARNHNKRCIRLLISNGAKVDIENDQGESGQTILERNGLLRYDQKSDINGHSQASIHQLSYVSDTALKMVQDIKSQFSNKLDELAFSVGNEYVEKQREYEESYKTVKRLEEEYAQLENTISQTQSRIMKLIAPDSNTDSPDYTEKQIEIKLESCLREVNERSSFLRQLLERREAKNLAQMIESKEKNIQSSNIEQDRLTDQENLDALIVLTGLQIRRKYLVDELALQYSDSSADPERMNQYRKLISLCCEVDFGEVDGLIDEIEEILRTN